jgi:hypothetical protein
MAETPINNPLDEFTTPLQEMAMVMHETFQAFLSAGFNEYQAMELIQGMARFNMNADEDSDEPNE